MKIKKIFFWQPQEDILKKLLSINLGKFLVIFLNYSIWVFLFFVSYLLVKKDPNIFWQLLLATIIGEIIEQLVKKQIYWRRPLFERKDKTPPGLVDRWYKTGSFPSGHSIKAVFFFLFILQYGVIHPLTFSLIAIPLILFRVLVGFHYPIDILGGLSIGTIIWFISRGIVFPVPLINLAKSAFDLVFFIH
ncbi:MAG: phosphatase PAP2 family protein [Candidatus Shapirobacteria bacterium]|nr:phosphatase PAP2 family protein [Candidatus Shapirobacteria bacterium]